MSALAARRSWVAFCPSVAHKQKLRSLSCLWALNQIRLANPPCLLLAILHSLSKHTRPVVRRQQHLTGWELPKVLSRPCLGLWACSVSDTAFFYYLISVSSSSSKCTGPIKFSRLLPLLDTDAAAANTADATLQMWRWADFCLLLTAVKSNVGGSGAGGQRLCELTNRLLLLSHPASPFHLAYNHPKVTVVKVPQVQHRWTDNPHAKKCW